MKTDILIKVYTEKEINQLSDKEFRNIACCYRGVFNKHWNEGWTTKAALAEVRRSLTPTIGRLPLLTLLFARKKVVGFAWIILTGIDYILEEDMPFNLCTEKKKLGIEVVRYWCNLVKKDKIVIYKELGILKEYRAHNGIHMASQLTLPIMHEAYDRGYRTLFYWTNPHNPTYKQGLGFGWHPIHYFINNDRVILKGGIKKLIYYLEGILNKNKAVLKEMRENTKNYLYN